jgi:uncharacterized membrane protein YeaQ/YmgE (transglycosylase-associated protein family)
LPQDGVGCGGQGKKENVVETLMTLVVWMLIGFGVGALAKLLMPGPDGGGFLLTSLLGIAGAVVGGWIASATGLASYTGFDFRGLVIAVLGAMLLLFVYRMLRHRTA